MPRTDSVYFVSDDHPYARIEDALSDAVLRSYQAQKHATVFVCASSRGAALRFGGAEAARQYDANVARGMPDDPLVGINVMARASLWG